MKEQNNGKKKQTDIWQIIFGVSLAVSLPKFSIYIPEVIPDFYISIILAGLGGGGGVLIAHILKNKSTVLKSFSFICCMGLIVSSMIFIPRPSKEELFSRTLVKISNSVNEQCPMVLDKDTRLDTTMAGPGNRLTYYYTLVNYLKSELDSEELKKNIKPNLINNAKTNKDMESFRLNRIELIYIYRDKENIEILRIAIQPDEYI
jgi:hypothetical protein